MSSPTPVRPAEEPNPTLYNARTLPFYDLVVRVRNHRFAWRCPYRHVQALYDRVGPEHLEIGPGDGLPLARLPQSTPLRELHLLDINTACLNKTQQRVGHRFTCHRYEAGALGPWPLVDASVDSAAASLLLHCLPGDSVWDKRTVVDNAARVVRDGGVFFGATYLGRRSLGHTRTARRRLTSYNNKQNVMHNGGDTLADLARLLLTHPDFTQVWVDVCGSVMLWRATRAPRVGGGQA